MAEKKKSNLFTIILLVILTIVFIIFNLDDNSSKNYNNSNGNSKTYIEGEGTISDCYIAIKDYSITTNYNEEPILLVKYSFNNIDDVAKTFSSVIDDTAYQNGVEIISPISTYGIENYNWRDKTKSIQPGATFEFNVAYELKDTNSDVTIELLPIIHNKYSTKISKTFSLNK